MSYGGGGGGGYYGGGGGGPGYGDNPNKRRRDDEWGGGGDQQRYRRDSGGYGGGGGGGGGRHRGGRWRDDDERRFEKKAHHPPQPRGPSRKPRTKEDEIMQQVKALLVKVADFNLISSSLSSLEENVEGLANALAGELATWGTFIGDYIITCAAQLPMQTSGYATLIGLLNAKDEEFGDKAVKKSGHKLQEFIHTGRWINAKLMLRFLAELVNARTVKAEGEGSLGALLTELMAPIKDDTVPVARKDFYAYLIASALPCVWETLSKEWPDGFPTLVNDIVSYGQQRTPTYRKEGLRSLLEAKLDEDDDGEPVQDSIQMAIGVVEHLSGSLEEGSAVSTEINAILKPWASVKEELSQGRRHGIPVVTLPDPDPMPEEPRIHDLPFHPAFAEFDIFTSESGSRPATLATLGPLERYVMRDYLKDMLVTFRPFVTEAGVKRGSYRSESEQLLSLSYFAAQDVATEYLVVEAILLWLIQLPGRDLPYIHRLLIDFVGYGEKPAGALLLGLVLLVQNYGELLDHVALVQLGDWFGSHLTNTQIKLPPEIWKHFASMVTRHEEDETDDHPDLFFLRRALDVAVRLTYVQRVKESIPEPQLHGLLPSTAYAVSRYLPADTPLQVTEQDPPATRILKNLIQQFKAIVTEAQGPQQVRAWLEAEHPGMNDEEPYWRHTLIAHAISAVMDNTICHMAALLEKCMDWFRDVWSEDEVQQHVIDSLGEVWAESPQMFGILLTDLMSKHIILPVNAVTWALREDNAKKAGKSALYWDLLSEAVEQSFQSVSNWGHIITTSVDAAYAREHGGQGQADYKDEAFVRSAVEQATLDNGQVAVENAQDVAAEIVEKAVEVLSGALSTEGDDAKDSHWFRATLSYFRNLLLRYVDVQNSPFNTYVPLSEPIVDLSKLREGVEEHLGKHGMLKVIFNDAQGFVDRKEQLGASSAHGQIFSED